MKYAVVTGANRGLGAGFVEHLLGEGHMVFGLARPNKTKSLTHERLQWIDCDVSDDTSIAAAYKAVSVKTDTLDLLINNAGVNKDSATDGHKEKVGTLQYLERSLLLKMFEINAVAPILMVKRFLPLLEKTESFVINISSDRASFDNAPSSTANYGYRASKVALNMMTKCSIFDLPSKVRAYAVHPGWVQSEMNPTGPQNPREQAAHIVAITKNWREELNGGFLNYDGSYFPL